MNELASALLQHKKPLLTALAAAAVVCWFLGNNFLNLVHNKLEFNRLTKTSARLDKEYEALQKQLELLKSQDPAYIEHVARVKYHMSKPGETEFRFKNK